MSRLVLNPKMMKYSKIWANGRKKVLGNKAIPRTASTSERSKSLGNKKILKQKTFVFGTLD